MYANMFRLSFKHSKHAIISGAKIVVISIHCQEYISVSPDNLPSSDRLQCRGTNADSS